MKILVVDDHALIREALRGVLKELKDDAVVLEASDCRQTKQLIENHPDLDLTLLDLTLPDGSGLDMLAGLRESHPAMSIVVLSALQDRDNVRKAFDLGAQGFIPKSAQRAVMLSALQLIFSGEMYIPAEILAAQASGKGAATTPAPAKTPTIVPADLGLTERQVDVLALM